MRLNGRASRTFAAALLGLSLSMPAWAARRTTATAGAARINIQIDNFGRVNDAYYRGAQPEGRDYDDLAALGVKTVIDLTGDDADRSEPSMVKRAGMKLVRIPMSTHETPSAEKVARFLRIIEDPANQPVYVHCVGGRHRTGVMTAAYRIANEGWTADQAFSEMKQYKFGAAFLHPEFKRFVYAYHSDRAPAVKAAVATKAGS